MLTSIAYAAAGNPGAAGETGGLFASFVPLILMFVVFYFLLIRPQQKRAKQHKEMLNALKKGDYVIKDCKERVTRRKISAIEKDWDVETFYIGSKKGKIKTIDEGL